MNGSKNDAKNIADKIILYLQSKNKSHLTKDVINYLQKNSDTDTKVVNVYSAQKLTEEQKRKVISKFSKITNNSNFIFNTKTDLIAGILVKYQDKIWDLSLKNQLENIRM